MGEIKKGVNVMKILQTPSNTPTTGVALELDIVGAISFCGSIFYPPLELWLQKPLHQ